MTADLLDQRLQRLAPEVDVEAARAQFRRRRDQAKRRRRQLYGVGVAAAGAAVLAAALVVVDRGADDASRPSVADSSGESRRTRAGEPRVITGEAHGIEVEVSVGETATAGTRLWFDVVIRNHGEDTVYWDSGGCPIPVEAVAGPVSTADRGSSRDDPSAGIWTGEPSALPAWVASHNTLSVVRPHQAEVYTAVRYLACPGNRWQRPLLPGDEVRHRGSFELRVPTGPLPGDGRYRLSVTFQPFATRAEGPEHSSLDPILVEVPLTVVDDEARRDDGADAALAAFAADPRLVSWLTSTAEVHRPGLPGTGSDPGYSTELSWWRGAWELWVTSRLSFEELRMRFDPRSGQVVDVRADIGGPNGAPDGAPDDEYGDTPHGGDVPDRVIPLGE